MKMRFVLPTLSALALTVVAIVAMTRGDTRQQQQPPIATADGAAVD
jgi:hypothetical protein